MFKNWIVFLLMVCRNEKSPARTGDFFCKICAILQMFGAETCRALSLSLKKCCMQQKLRLMFEGVNKRHYFRYVADIRDLSGQMSAIVEMSYNCGSEVCRIFICVFISSSISKIVMTANDGRSTPESPCAV